MARFVDLLADAGIDYDVSDLETDPAKILQEVASYRELLQQAAINDAARANILPFSTAGDLDHLASFHDVIRLAGESDAALRKRVQLAIAGRSTGGTAARYRYVALSVGVQVKDAIVWREGRDPTVNVAVYSTAAGGVASGSLLATVRAALEAASVRMVNDAFRVVSAVTQTQNVSARLWLFPETPDSVLQSIESNLRAAWAARAGLGVDMTRAWLTSALMQAGVQNVEILAPVVDLVMPPNQAAALGTVTLSIAGRAV
jgi:phage-related baseplate assembly protein